MYYNLFLDDERAPKQVTWVDLPAVPWTIARSYKEFVKIVTDWGLPTCVSFDHDLCAEHYRASMYNPDRHYNQYYSDGTFKEKTGYDCAKWMVDYCTTRGLPLPECYVHTMNPIGRENIIKALRSQPL